MQGGRQARVGEQSAEVHSVLVGGERMSVCLGERVSATASLARPVQRLGSGVQGEALRICGLHSLRRTCKVQEMSNHTEHSRVPCWLR